VPLRDSLEQKSRSRSVSGIPCKAIGKRSKSVFSVGGGTDDGSRAGGQREFLPKRRADTSANAAKENFCRLIHLPCLLCGWRFGEWYGLYYLLLITKDLSPLFLFIQLNTHLRSLHDAGTLSKTWDPSVSHLTFLSNSIGK
jgi:hypothetical protein